MGACGCIGGSVECFQSGEESTRSDVNCGGFMVEIGGGNEVSEVIYDGIWGRREANFQQSFQWCV